ncbi:aminotransferase class I/II-fold pyridoxal phosphate-dependent enzyme [Paralcaligenes sp. KSB-10]|uniref:aminotransferase class I/II-fold pyridoxal phosphate-dependent enzyme n=1 Tax=Paralcaligenes sp. KSB-10 TaxID=2901142 RepID=UPI001E4F5455|nr:aminotransferase class I/II-fold pyridoxal phosphate-dependent enzyme [Paralcaligenes sp. KSB-10]UHL65280.1 aminotransferase class I/II-fold pyridoxal phosphate-dependent enzyme [Paralcaligenes sp. KSB-10]
MLKRQKNSISELALFSGGRLFEKPRSTSNLVRPDIERFLEYSKALYQAGQYETSDSLATRLERRLAEFHNTRYCVCFCSGFWALVLAIRSLAVPGRMEVVMPSLTYRRLGDVVAWAGLVPRYCDVDPNTLAISPQTAEFNIGPNTALIIGVHPIVNCCDALGLEQLAGRHAVPILFDGVESVYESVAGRKVGSFGDAECFSLHASKLLNGFEGGYLTTNNKELADKLLGMREFDFTSEHTETSYGTNAKLSEIHAAMALASLDDLEEQVARNRERYRVYQDVLQDIAGIRLLPFDESERCSFKNIVVELTGEWELTRELTLELLNAEGMLSRAYYSPPLHVKKTMYPTISGNLPVTEHLAERFMLMPCGHFVSKEDILEIAHFLTFIKGNAADIKSRVTQ